MPKDSKLDRLLDIEVDIQKPNDVVNAGGGLHQPNYGNVLFSEHQNKMDTEQENNNMQVETRGTPKKPEEAKTLGAAVNHASEIKIKV